MSITEALHTRARNVAALLASRLGEPGLWQGYTADEPLVGELRLDTLLTYHRRHDPMAVIVFRTPVFADLGEIDWGEPVIIESNVDERYTSHIVIEKPVDYRETVSHTFAATRSLQQQAAVGLEVAVGAEVGTQGGIHGVTAKVNISAKVSAQYQRTWGETASRSDTATRELSGRGPIRIDYEAVRTKNTEQRRVRSRADFEHSVELIDERQGIAPDNRPFMQHVVPTWAQFLATVQGFAPAESIKDGQPRRNAFYDEFVHDPLRGDPFLRLSEPSSQVVEALVEYDNVLRQEIKIL